MKSELEIWISKIYWSTGVYKTLNWPTLSLQNHKKAEKLKTMFEELSEKWHGSEINADSFSIAHYTQHRIPYHKQAHGKFNKI